MISQTVKDFLAAGRVANLPSVVSNVLLGAGFGIFTGSSFAYEPVFFLPCLVGCLLYLGGCFLNDWKDQAWDAKNRPERALPSGRISSRTMLIVASASIVLGLSIAAFLNTGALVAAVILVAFILLYTYLHKRTAWGVVPMGMCRGMLYFLGFWSQKWRTHFGDLDELFLSDSPSQLELSRQGQLIWELFDYLQILGIPFLGIIAYVAGLSVFARMESRPVVPKWSRVLGIGLMAGVVITHALFWARLYPVWTGLAVLPFFVSFLGAVYATFQSVPRGVSRLLATICLVDFIAAVPLSVILFARSSEMFKFGGQEALLFPLVSISAFLLALLLQRVAPAT